MSSLKDVRTGNTRHPLYPLYLGIFGILCVIAGIVFAAEFHQLPSAAAEPNGTGALNAQPAINSPNIFSGNPFRDVVKKIKPAVVNIVTERPLDAQMDGQMPDNPFHFQLPPQGPEDMQPQQKDPFGNEENTVETGGSGFLVDDVGHIITNNHVIEHAERITVTLDDGRQFDAKLVGTDPSTDVAVIQLQDLKGEKTPYLRLGDSEAAEIGDWVIAVGSPLGLQETVTVGVVSAKNRNSINIPGAEYKFSDFIQTDAAINFGNSGGPLLTTDGMVLGMNTAIAGGANVSGIGFAVPANKIKFVYQNLITTGKVRRGYIGIYVGDLSHGLAMASGLPSTKGAVVTKVDPNTPAGRAGIKFGDIITAVNGDPVQNKQNLVNLVAEKGVGVDLTLSLLRDKQPMQLRIKTEQRPDEADNPSSAKGNAQPDNGPGIPDGTTLQELGLKISTFDPRDYPDLDVPAGTTGVFVDAVKKGSDAYREGIDEGVIITYVNADKVTDIASFRTALDKSAGDYAKLTVMRKVQDEWVSFIYAIPIPAK